jgi:hypothetical protein
MPSTVIKQIEYDAPSARMVVTFTSGKRYGYEDVPAEEVEAFRHAPSKGQFFNQRVRDRYRVQLIRARSARGPRSAA